MIKFAVKKGEISKKFTGKYWTFNDLKSLGKVSKNKISVFKPFWLTVAGFCIKESLTDCLNVWLVIFELIIFFIGVVVVLGGSLVF